MLSDTQTASGDIQSGIATWREFHLVFTWNAPSCPKCLCLGLKMIHFYQKGPESRALALLRERAAPIKGQHSSRRFNSNLCCWLSDCRNQAFLPVSALISAV